MIFTGWDTPLGLVKAELVQKDGTILGVKVK